MNLLVLGPSLIQLEPRSSNPKLEPADSVSTFASNGCTLAGQGTKTSDACVDAVVSADRKKDAKASFKKARAARSDQLMDSPYYEKMEWTRSTFA